MVSNCLLRRHWLQFRQENEIERIYAEKNFRDGISANFRLEFGIVERLHSISFVAVQAKQKNASIPYCRRPGNGAASCIASKIFSAFGYTVMPLNDTPDGTFPGRSPEPRKRHTGNTWQFVKDNGLDIASVLMVMPIGSCLWIKRDLSALPNR